MILNLFNKILHWLIVKFDIDLLQLSAMLSVKKLLLTGKAELTGSTSTESSLIRWLGVINWQLLLYFFLGLSFCLGFVFESIITGMTVIYTLLMIVLIVTFFMQFAGTLLDTAENQIFLSKPVSGATILIARVIHASYYMGKSTLFLGLPALLFTAYIHGIVTAMLFLIGLILLLILLMVTVQVLLILASSRIDPKKIRKLAMLFLMVFFIASLSSSIMIVQVITETVSAEELRTYRIDGAWLYFYPPAWMAGLVSAFSEGAEGTAIVLSLIAIVVPCIGLPLSIYFLGSRFNKILSDLGNRPGNVEHEIEKSKRFIRNPWWNFLGGNDSKKAIYQLSLKLMTADESFKIKVYPTYGVIIALVCMFIFKHYKNSPEDIVGSGSFLSNLYFFTSFFATTISYVQYGNQYKAAWVYRVLPIERPGELISMTILAYIVRFVLPVSAMVIVVSGILGGGAGVVDALFAGVVTVLVCFLQSYRFRYIYPLSRNFNEENSGKNTFLDQFLITVPVVVLLAGLHALLKFNIGPVAVAFGCLVLSLATYIFFRRLYQRGWEYYEYQ